MTPSTPARTRFLCSLVALFAAACGDPGPRPVGAACDDNGACESGVCGGGQCLAAGADNDGDSLTNALEARLGSDPTAADTDADGLADLGEVDPATFTNRDTDQDGLADIVESAVADADADCITDQFDAENDIANGDLSPMRDVVCSSAGVCADQRANLAVSCASGAAACVYKGVVGFASPEAACDGVDENCDGTADDGFPDRDGDHIADCVDTDLDNDAVADALDNCPVTANADQEDSDSDGVGEACVGDYTLVFEQQPTDVVTGAPFADAITVRLAARAGSRAAQLRVVPSFHGTVTLALAPTPPGSVLAGTTSVVASDGLATFADLAPSGLNTGLVLVASSGALGGADSAPFDVLADTPPPSLDHFDVAFPGGRATAGVAAQATVTARDGAGHAIAFVGRVVITTSDPHASYPSAYDFTLADLGVALLDGFVFQTAGAQTVTVTAANLPGAGTAPVLVGAGGPAGFTLSGLPTQVTAGSLPAVALDVVDTYGNPVASYGGTFALTNTDPRCADSTLPMLPANQGHLEFAACLQTAGVQTITVTGPGTLGTEHIDTLVVAHEPANHLVLSRLPATVIVGTPTRLSVDLRDDFDNSVTTFVGTVTLTSDDPQALLPLPLAFDGTQSGAREFTVAFITPGVHTLNATTGTLGDFTTTNALPPPPHHLRVTANPATVVAGAPFELRITAVDALDQPTGFVNAAVDISAPAGGCDAVSATLENGEAVVPDFHCTRADLREIDAATAGPGALAGQVIVRVNPAAADHLVLTWDPQVPVVTGASFPDPPLVHVLDAYDNLQPAPLPIAARLLRNPGRARLTGATTVIASLDPAHFDAMSMDRAGSAYTLEFTAPDAPNVTPAVSVPFDAEHAPPDLLIDAIGPDGGCTAIDFTLEQGASAPVDLAVTFTVGAETKPATIAGARSTTGQVQVRTAPLGVHRRLVWNDHADLPREDAEDVTISVTATTSDGQTATATSQPVRVENAWRWTHVPATLGSSSTVVGASVADVNRDGYEDVFRLAASPPMVLIEMGGPEGFTSFSFGALSIPTPVAMLLFDIDQDGTRDLVIADSVNAIHTYRIERQFGQPFPFIFTEWQTAGGTPCTPGASIRTLSAAQLEARKSPTIAVGCSSPDGQAQAAVVFFEPTTNAGEVTLFATTSIGLPPTADPMAVITQDLDHDGAVECAIGVRDATGGPGVRVFTYGDGWGNVATLGTPNTTALAVGDFDRDGQGDLAVADDLATLTLYLAADHYTTPIAVPVDPILTTLDAVTAADLDDDGLDDLVAGSRAADAVVIMRTYDWPTAAADALVTPFDTGDAGPLEGVVALVARDFRHSGHRDVLVVRGHGTAGFVPDILRTVAPVPCDPGFAAPSGAPASTITPARDTQPLIADVDGDGRLDATYLRDLSGIDGGALITWGNGSGGFRATTQAIDAVGVTMEGAFGDVDGDGDLDLALLDWVAGIGQVDLWQQVTPSDWTPLPSLPNASKGLLFEDFDLDGRADIAFAEEDPDTQTSTIHLFLAGSAGFTERPTLAVVGLVGGIAAADLDHDGALDLALQRHDVSGAGSTACIVRASATGWPHAPGTIDEADCFPSLGALTSHFSFHDLDADGTLELVVVAEGRRIGVFALTPDDSGTFVNRPPEMYDLCPEGMNAFALGDVNGDHMDDVVVSCDTGSIGAMRAFFHTWSGTRYGPDAGLSFGFDADRPLAIAPFDGLGSDLLAGDTLFHLAPDDLGGATSDNPDTFEVLPDPVTAGIARWVVDDFDGDRRLDFAATDALSPGTFDVALGTAAGGFQTYSTGVGISAYLDHIAAGDLSGDGRPDLILTTANGVASQVLIELWSYRDGFQYDSGLAFTVGGTPTALALAPLGHFLPNGTIRFDDGRTKAIIGMSANEVGGEGRLAVLYYDVATLGWTLAHSAPSGVPLPDDLRAVGGGRFRADLQNELVVAGNRAGTPVITLARLDACDDGSGPYACIHTTSEFPLTGFPALAATTAVFGDLDHDGDTDVVIALASATAYDARAIVVRQTSPGAFTVDATVLTSPSPYAWLGLADLDASGRADLLALPDPVAAPGCPVPEIAFRALDPTNITFVTRAATPTHGACPRGLGVFDVDQDGRLDLLSVDRAGALRPLPPR